MKQLTPMIQSIYLTQLKEAAEKAEFNWFKQQLHFNDKYQKLVNQKGWANITDSRIMESLGQDNDWKQALKSWIKDGALSKVEEYSKLSDSELQKLVDIVEKRTIDWLATSDDGKDYIAGQGFNQLWQEIQTGRWSTNDQLIGDIQLAGLKRELIIALSTADWMYGLDPKSITIETKDFTGRHQEGRFDVMAKFSHAELGKGYSKRRPIRLESKLHLDNFALGTINNHFLYNAQINWIKINGNNGQIAWTFNEQNLQSLIDIYLKEKYAQGGEWNKSNILPMFTDGTEIMLFSEFIDNVVNGDHGLYAEFDDQDLMNQINLLANDPKIPAVVTWLLEGQRVNVNKFSKTLDNIKTVLWYGKMKGGK